MASLPRAMPWARSFCPFRAYGWQNNVTCPFWAYNLTTNIYVRGLRVNLVKIFVQYFVGSSKSSTFASSLKQYQTKEDWQSDRMRWTRNPVYPLPGIGGLNPSSSAKLFSIQKKSAESYSKLLRICFYLIQVLHVGNWLKLKKLSLPTVVREVKRQ